MFWLLVLAHVLAVGPQGTRDDPALFGILALLAVVTWLHDRFFGSEKEEKAWQEWEDRVMKGDGEWPEESVRQFQGLPPLTLTLEERAQILTKLWNDGAGKYFAKNGLPKY